MAVSKGMSPEKLSQLGLMLQTTPKVALKTKRKQINYQAALAREIKKYQFDPEQIIAEALRELRR